jgi:hypothetical protein
VLVVRLVMILYAERENGTPAPTPVPASRPALQARVATRTVRETSPEYRVELKIPELSIEGEAGALAEVNAALAAPQLQRQQELRPEAVQYHQDMKERFGIERPPFELVSDFKVTLQRPGFVSLYTDLYEYTGGAHGATTRRGATVELEQARLLSLADLFVEGFDWNQALLGSIREQMQAQPDLYFEDAASKLSRLSAEQPYYLEPGNVVVFFAQYELAPYAAGIPEFRVPVQVLAAGLRPEVREALSSGEGGAAAH